MDIVCKMRGHKLRFLPPLLWPFFIIIPEKKQCQEKFYKIFPSRFAAKIILHLLDSDFPL